MPETTAPAKLAVCPDCGGILHATHPVPLTSAEVASADEAGWPGGLLCQCLLCGYQEVRPLEDEA